jgi:CheY-like chemotaxis protein
VSKIVLCVDDSATMQQVADITFRGTDFQYVGARNYDEAIEKAKGGKPAVVLADASMPGKSGYDLCLALKSDSKTADVPVVILVGNSAPYDATLAAKVGADGQLPKPWDTQTMLDKVGEVVAKAASGVAKPGGAPAPAAAPAAAAKPAAPAAPANVPAPAATAGSGAANQPPRSATIMGMPTIKMPAGVAPTATAAPAPAPAPVAPAPVAPKAPAAPAAAAAPAMRAPAPAAAPAPVAASSSNGNGSGGAHVGASGLGLGRSSMISGSATKRSALVEATLARMGQKLAEATGLAAGSPELIALVKLSAEVVERIVWEVVPDLAEQIIKENLRDLTAKKASS